MQKKEVWWKKEGSEYMCGKCGKVTRSLVLVVKAGDFLFYSSSLLDR